MNQKEDLRFFDEVQAAFDERYRRKKMTNLIISMVILTLIEIGKLPSDMIPYFFLDYRENGWAIFFSAFAFVYGSAYLMAWRLSEWNRRQSWLWFKGITNGVWQYFLYHSMVVTLGLYMGFGPDSDVSLRGFRSAMGLLLMLDMPTFYLNSIFSQPVYEAGKPTGILYRTNFFSSYVNPLGLTLTEKWQWLLYLLIRLGLASSLIALLLCLAALRRRPVGMDG